MRFLNHPLLPSLNFTEKVILYPILIVIALAVIVSIAVGLLIAMWPVSGLIAAAILVGAVFYILK